MSTVDVFATQYKHQLFFIFGAHGEKVWCKESAGGGLGKIRYEVRFMSVVRVCGRGYVCISACLLVLVPLRGPTSMSVVAVPPTR